MTNRIITISRQFGSGGRTIGREVAQKLGIPCYDEELINKIAQKSGLAKEYIADRGEYAPSGSWWGNVFASRDHNGHSLRDDLWQIQREVILELAAQGPCVIVGRCADHILKEKKPLTVFIHASMESRAERIVQLYGDREEKPEQRLLDKDKRRKAYYQIYTDTEWGNATNYTLCLDSSALGIEKCVSLIVDLYSHSV